MGSFSQPEYVDATFYVVVRPTWSRYQRDDRDRPVLEAAKLERATQGRPGSLRGDAVVTRLTLRIDAAALLPLQPQAIVHVRADDVEVIEVTADQPAEGCPSCDAGPEAILNRPESDTWECQACGAEGGGHR